MFQLAPLFGLKTRISEDLDCAHEVSELFDGVEELVLDFNAVDEFQDFVEFLVN